MDWQNQARLKEECNYHVLMLPKFRRKTLYGRLRWQIGQILRELCQHKDIWLVEDKAMPDHVHMILSVPLQNIFAMTIEYLKGKSAIRIHRTLLKTKGMLFGRTFWARWYFVSTVGMDEVRVREYIKNLETLQY